MTSSMQSQALPLSKLPQTSKLFATFLDDFSRVTAYYDHPPTLEGVRASAGKVTLDPETRQQVVKILREQNARFAPGRAVNTATVRNLDRLAAGAVAIVTGQQVGLFSGPSYSVYKALSALRWADALTKEGVEAVPVFWLATEDHDLAEVNHNFIPGADGNLVELRSAAASVEDAPVGNVRFGPEIEQAVAQAAETLGDSEMTDALRAAYRSGETMGSAFGKLFASIFREWGVILMDPYDAEFHRIAEPIYRAAIENAAEFDELLLARGKELETAGYHQQVKVTSTSTLLFEIKDGRRTVVQRSNDHFKVGDQRCTREELLARISTAPEKFSPNVLLRPIVQDFLLPTLAYTGGPAEVAYFAQVGVVYERLLQRVTPVLARFSATIIAPHQAKLLEKYGLKLTDLFHGEERLRVLMSQKVLPPSMQQDFADAAATVKLVMEKIRADLQQLDATLVDSANTAEAKMKYQVEQLESRAARAQLTRNEVIERHARQLSTILFPNKDLQERQIGGVYFLAKHGFELLHTLYEAARQDCPDHQVVYV